MLLAGLAGLATSASGGSTQLPQPVQDVLTTIDTIPTQVQLDTAFVDHQLALQGLAVIARDPETDTGMRLRAIHALSRYCATTPCADGDVAHLALVGLIDDLDTSDVTSGENLVLLRGAIESLGPQRVGTDLDLLVNGAGGGAGLLTHQSRDIRAATVHALRDLCNTQAINPLRVQLQQEPTAQVRLAISEALRILGQTQPCQ